MLALFQEKAQTTPENILPAFLGRLESRLNGLRHRACSPERPAPPLLPQIDLGFREFRSFRIRMAP
jgi:hypothetical protein